MSALDGFFRNLSDEENSDGVLEESVPSQAFQASSIELKLFNL